MDSNITTLLRVYWIKIRRIDTMKKLFMLLAIMMVTLSMSACDTEDYVTQDELDETLSEYATLNDVNQSQIERFMTWLLESLVVDGDTTFVEFGTTYEETIDYWDYITYIVEVDEDTTIEVTILQSMSLDVSVYDKGNYEDYNTIEITESTYTETFTVSEGFFVFEVETYEDDPTEVDYQITFEIVDQE
jgi:hypothetical protein